MRTTIEVVGDGRARRRIFISAWKFKYLCEKTTNYEENKMKKKRIKFTNRFTRPITRLY